MPPALITCMQAALPPPGDVAWLCQDSDFSPGLLRLGHEKLRLPGWQADYNSVQGLLGSTKRVPALRTEHSIHGEPSVRGGGKRPPVSLFYP